MNRPLTLLARQTQTDAELLPPRPQRNRLRISRGGPAEAKTAITARADPFFCLKGMRLLPGQVFFERNREGRTSKKCFLSADCLRVSVVKIFAGLSNSIRSASRNLWLRGNHSQTFPAIRNSIEFKRFKRPSTTIPVFVLRQSPFALPFPF